MKIKNDDIYLYESKNDFNELGVILNFISLACMAVSIYLLINAECEPFQFGSCRENSYRDEYSK